MSIKAVVFDVGGVLVLTIDFSRLHAWERRLGLAKNSLSRTVYTLPTSVRANIGQATTDDVWAEVAERFSLEPSELVQFQDDFWSGAIWNELLLAYARTLKQHYKTGIISTAWPGTRDAIAEYVSPEIFDVIVYSAEEGVAKPNSQIFERTLARLQVSPAEAIFIDDVEANVEAARTIGLYGILFKDTWQVIAQINDYLHQGRLTISFSWK